MSRGRGAPPSFAEGATLRQRARATGMDPDYWYAVEEVRRIRPGTVVEVVFWRCSIALFRASDGSFRAVENRCAHRQIKLSLGEVRGCRLVCAYHGWQYDGDGRCVEIPHERYGRGVPRLALRSYPVQVRYGLIWLFPGDPEKAPQRRIPDIPELEGSARWACVPLTFTWSAHHSMVIDNVSDFSHAHLHRRYRPFEDARLTRCDTVGDSVHVAYETRIGGGRISGRFVERDRIDTGRIELCFEYPYQWSNTDDAIKHWLFVLPVDERTTRVFFLFYFKSLKIPGLPIRIPRAAMTTVMRLSNRLAISPLLDQDRFAVEAEQRGYERHWDALPVELNPAVRAFQEVTVRKWREYLERESGNDHDAG